MTRHVLACAISALVLIGVAAAAHGQDATIALPLALQGLVHREVGFGCGQSWDARIAQTNVTLEVNAHRRAVLHIDARIVEASGGVSIVGDPIPFHHETERTLTVVWRGRARATAEGLVIRLRSLVETAPVVDSPSGVVITNRTILEAHLTCAREEHDLLAASRPSVPSDAEPAVAHRVLTSCTFAPVEHEGPLPRPVRDALTPTFFLDEGEGVTTDATYRGSVSVPAQYLVARVAGWVDGE